MIPNITVIVTCYVITQMVKILTDKETGTALAACAIVTIVISLVLCFLTISAGFHITELDIPAPK